MCILDVLKQLLKKDISLQMLVHDLQTYLYSICMSGFVHVYNFSTLVSYTFSTKFYIKKDALFIEGPCSDLVLPFLLLFFRTIL